MKINRLKFPRFRSTTSFFIYSIFCLIILISFSLPWIQAKYIHPSIIKLLINHTEELAIKTANHLKRGVVRDDENGEIYISYNFNEFLNNVKQDYQLYKIRVFSMSGKILYSSSADEIGTINDNDYFHNIVAEGNIYSKIDHKNTKSLEGQIISDDVVEVYIPIISQQGKFIGAFELYYSIGSFRHSLGSLIKHFNFLLHSLVLTIILVVSYSIYLFYKNSQAQQNYQKELIKIAETDTLTKLYNRSRLDKELFKSLENYKRHQRTFSIILIDVDYFKSVNDQFGHLKGDKVLTETALLLKNHSRITDIVGRWGGEEFLIICNETDNKGALIMSELIRNRIAQHTFDIPIGITACFGIAQIEAKMSLDHLLSNADHALYACKEKGRNQSFVFNPAVSKSAA